MSSKNKSIRARHVEIPAQEQWLFDNKTALKQVKQGLKDSATGRVHDNGPGKSHITIIAITAHP
jgi:hypothetical protein